MIERVADLNRFLLAIKLLREKNQNADKKAVEYHFKSIVIEGRIPDFELIVVFSEQLEFVRRRKNQLKLTTSGELFLELNPEETYDLSEQQKRFILRKCFLDCPLHKQTRLCLKEFAFSSSKGTYRWSETDSSPLKSESWVSEHLYQIGFLKGGKDWLEVKSKYTSTAYDFINTAKGWTEEQQQEYFKEKKELGDIAEEIILNYERNRISKLGHKPEAACVRKISKTNVSAGYDIESFDGKSKSMIFDRFIEVKGSGKATVRFIWSTNEIEVAKKVGEKYWIYFQGGIDKKNKKAKNKPLLFQNPVQTVMKDSMFTKAENGILVTAPIAGEINS